MGVSQVAWWLLAAVLTCDGQSYNSGASKARKLPGLDVCGTYRVVITQSIIGGTPAELGQFPWMANIGYVTRGDSTVRWLCGGSLISDQYIITAAHCLHPSTTEARRSPIYAKKVRLGELDLNPSVEDYANPIDFDIEKITYHQDYNNAKKINDIALIKLKQKVTFSNLIAPICLPAPQFQEQSLVGKIPVIAGWGKNVTDGSTELSTNLLWAEVQIKDTEECSRNITRALKNAVIDHRVVCASAKKTDSCQGDSGGPLMLVENIRRKSPKMNYFLIGIVAYGYGCALEGYPGVYTRVSEYMDWVLDNMDI